MFTLIVLLIFSIFIFILCIAYMAKCSKNDELERILLNMKIDLSLLQSENKVLNSLLKSSSQYQNQDIVDAVKYAMIHSHPDNGGNKDDFIKYMKVYKNLKNKV